MQIRKAMPETHPRLMRTFLSAPAWLRPVLDLGFMVRLLSGLLLNFYGAVERSPVVEGERLGHMNKCLLHAVRLLPVLLATPMTLAQPSACEQAWADYKAFKARTVMEESQYPLTVQGAAVRAACGADALPAPPGADMPPPPRVRKSKPPAPPPNPSRNP